MVNGPDPVTQVAACRYNHPTIAPASGADDAWLHQARLGTQPKQVCEPTGHIGWPPIISPLLEWRALIDAENRVRNCLVDSSRKGRKVDTGLKLRAIF